MSRTVGNFQVFGNDAYVRLMPQLRAEGLVPASMVDVMRARLEALNGNDKTARAFWLDNYFDTVDGVAYSGKRVKVVLDAQPLRDINSNTTFGSALILSPEEYGVLEGQEFLRADLEKAGIGKYLRKGRVKTHPVWQALVRDDNRLLSDYVDVIFAEVEARFGEDGAMGVLLPFFEMEQPTMRAWVAFDLLNRSNAGGSFNLDDYARLLGVRAGGAAQNRPLENRV